jgi:crotonyl-CoA carboxylase/reductase
MGKDLYELGEVAPIGEVPPKMYANAVRPENYGEPEQAFRIEVLDTPKPARNQVVVQVMASGVNYNNVWAAKGIPLDVTKVHEKLGQPANFHIGGSDASGIVAAIGEGVTNVKVGDRVVVHCGWFDPEDAEIVAGRDPGFTSTYKIWGYETNYGSFAQFCLAYAHQCMPKAEQLTWEEAAAPTLVGSTAYRMLRGWPPNVVNEGDPVLIWGGSGGLGSMAIQIVKEFGGLPVAVVSSDDKGEYTKKLGAVGYINRKDFSHWGVPPHWKDPEWKNWFSGAKDFGKKFWEVLGERRNPAIVSMTLRAGGSVCNTRPKSI